MLLMPWNFDTGLLQLALISKVILEPTYLRGGYA